MTDMLSFCYEEHPGAGRLARLSDNKYNLTY